MAAKTKIAWTDDTFNIVEGCQRVSPGCDRCYAADRDRRFHGAANWGDPHSTPRLVHTPAYWRQPVRWNRAAQREGRQRRVFCSSLADVFEQHSIVATERQKLWPMIEQTPWLNWLLLTKRPQNIRRMLPSHWLDQPRRNVWLGTSVELQEYAALRIPRLLEVPAVVHFVSAEPLLGPLDLAEYLGPERITWVIAGGETGHGFRPMDTDWARTLRDQCVGAGVAYFFKQSSHRYEGRGIELDGRLEHSWPA